MVSATLIRGDLRELAGSDLMINQGLVVQVKHKHDHTGVEVSSLPRVCRDQQIARCRYCR